MAVAWGAAMFTAPLNGWRVGPWLTVCDVFLAVAVVATVASPSHRRRDLDGVDRALLVGIALITVGVLLGTSFGAVLSVGLVRAARFLLAAAGAVVALTLWAPPRAVLRSLCLVWLAGAVFNSLWALLAGPTVAGRGVGLASHPNSLGLVCILGIGVAVACLGATRWPTVTMLAAGVCVVLLGAAISSGSRAALLGVVAAVPAVAVLCARRRVAGLSAALAVVVGGAVFVGMVHASAFGDIGRPVRDPSTVESDARRLGQLDRSLDRIGDHPLTGQGFRFAHEAHSVYLQVLVATGPLGLIGLGVVSGSLLVSVRRGIAREHGAVTGDRALLAGMAGGYVGYLVAAAFQNSLSESYVWLYVAGALALAADLRREHDRVGTLDSGRIAYPGTFNARQQETVR